MSLNFQLDHFLFWKILLIIKFCKIQIICIFYGREKKINVYGQENKITNVH